MISQDTSDHQWNVFRSNLPMLGALVILWCLASHFYNRYLFPTSRPSSPRPIPSTQHRTTFILLFAFPLLLVLHGTSVFKMLVILGINYQISKLSLVGGKLGKAAPLIAWGFNLAVLFGNEICEGYRWSSLSAELAFLVSDSVVQCSRSSTLILVGLSFSKDADSIKGILPRWHINWNITMLRLVSFDMDYYWACTANPSLSNPSEDSKVRYLLFFFPKKKARH